MYKPTANGNGFTLATGGSTFTSHPKGVNDPGALNLEGDIITYNFSTAQGNSYIKVWGVGLGMIGQAANLNGANFMLMAGMRPGLPLATAQAPQAGIIAQGVVFQTFGNWQGNDQTLDLIFNPGALATGQNISFNWPAGTPLAQSLAATLTQAFPTYQQKISIANLVLPNTEAGYYTNISQFGSGLTELTQEKGARTHGQNYPGVQITIIGNTVYAYDTTVPTPAKLIAFQDLVGQPTWINAGTVSFKTVLRSDLVPGSRIKFPQGIQAPYALTAPSAVAPGAPVSSRTAFQGEFVVNDVHHYMNFRQPDGDSWATVYTASAITLTNN